VKYYSFYQINAEFNKFFGYNHKYSCFLLFFSGYNRKNFCAHLRISICEDLREMYFFLPR